MFTRKIYITHEIIIYKKKHTLILNFQITVQAKIICVTVKTFVEILQRT